MGSFDDFVNSLVEVQEADMAAATAGKPDNREKFPCGQCAGTGKYRGVVLHHDATHCFACRGKGHFLTSPEFRLKARQRRAESAANARERGLAVVAADHPLLFTELATVRTQGSRNEFISSLAGQLFAKGTLTENQINAWYRGRAKLDALIAERAAEDEARKVVVDLSPIAAMFETAMANGLKRPAYRAEGLVLKPAKAHSANPGAIYVTDVTGEYMGKVASGVFHPMRHVPVAPLQTALEMIAADPKEAAVAYGRRTGKCACCGRELTDAASVAMGIGPICADKWGF